MKADPKTSAGRAFVRSLNILLKFARLYGYEHVRTNEQLHIASEELHTAIPPGTEGGLLLGATGSQILLDGVPLEGSPAEKQFAQLLSSAGLASVQFFASVTDEELGRFARAFPAGKAKPSELVQQLKSALAGTQGIRINEICFVATDSRLKDASMAAQIAAASLGDDQDQFKKWLNDPQKLLELIAAAQGSKEGSGAGAEGSGEPGLGGGGTGYTGGGGIDGSGGGGNIGGGDFNAGGGGPGGGGGGDYSRIFTGKEVTSKARLISKPEPQYTEDARKNQITGTVVLKVVFASSGQVTNIRTVSGLPYGLTERAIAAARLIKFVPASKDGHQVSMWMQLEYNFNLY